MGTQMNVVDSNDVASLMTAIRSQTSRTEPAEWPVGVLSELNHLPKPAINFIDAVAGQLSILNANYVSTWNSTKTMKDMYIYQANQSSLTEINLSNCLQINNTNMFSGSQNVQKYTLGISNVTSNMFSGNLGINEISLPNCLSIDECGFYQCRNLRKINIPECTKISASAFAADSRINNPIYFRNCSYFGSCAFYQCYNISEFRDDADGLITIENSAFMWCQNLKSIAFPMADNIVLGEQVFAKCIRLIDFNIGANISIIPQFAFSDCRSLQNIDNIVRTTSQIGFCAFSGCTSLSKIVLPAIEYIASSAFYGCTNVSEIVIGENLQQICSNAFVSLSALEIFDMRFTSRHVVLERDGLPKTYELTKDLKIYVPDSDVAYYKSFTTANWSYYGDYIYGASQYPVLPVL